MNYHWKKLDSQLLCKTVIFDLCSQRMLSPDGAFEDDYYYLDISSCVNVIPITADNQVVLIRQYRHGINDLTLEFPGGLIDKKENDPQATALRELSEETGYAASEIIDLGWTHTNPPLFNSRCYSFAAVGASPIADQQLDRGEFIKIELHPLHDIPRLIRENQFTHGNMIATFFQFAMQCGRRFGLEQCIS